MRYMLLISINFMLSACGIGGYWMNGDPSAGRNIKPYLHHWEKHGVTSEQRREDSWTCGAGETAYGADHVAFSQKQAAAEKQMNEKDDIAARVRLREIWKNCMENKGYRHIP